ncbi:MAG: DUF6036 family nucleotidyltransferase [Planctomycetota bacterium]
MDSAAVQTIFRALNRARVRYLLVGGLAVVAHGYVRMTADVDLIVDLKEKNLLRALEVFRKLGYRPRVPVSIEQFADSRLRSLWVRKRNMKVFSLFSDRYAMTEVDLFVKAPFPFAKAFSRRRRLEVVPGVRASIAGYKDLLFLKRKAGRPQDLQDIRALQSLGREK